MLLITALVMGLLVGCSGRNEGRTQGKSEEDEGLSTIRIAKQFGLVYAPLMVAEKVDFFSEYGFKTEWVTLGSGGALREAIAAGEVDLAFMGIPPFLIGWDKGLPAKIAAGYCISPISLITYDDSIHTIKDFTPEHKIGLPSPGSIQHILLSMASEKELGDPDALYDNLVPLPHPDGAQAMLAKKDIVAHFTTSPYL